MNKIADYLDALYRGDGATRVYRNELIRVVREFLDSGLADPKYEIELTWGFGEKLWPCLSEALVYQRIKHLNPSPGKKLGVGPDFLIEHRGIRIWIEVICPEPKGVPDDWFNLNSDDAIRVPHDEILLRWANAIDAKTEKLVGSKPPKEKVVVGYLDKAIVAKNDVYVIAVNGCRMRNSSLPSFHGISQLPYAVEALFPVGPYGICIDQQSLKQVGGGYQLRFNIRKSNGSPVATDVFPDPWYENVSAVWAVDFNGASSIGHCEPSALIFNPNSLQPLPRGLILADDEFVAEKSGSDEYTLNWDHQAAMRS